MSSADFFRDKAKMCRDLAMRLRAESARDALFRVAQHLDQEAKAADLEERQERDELAKDELAKTD